MTDLRQAAQQALDALERADKDDFWREQRDAITALHKALEQPEQEPLTDEQITAVINAMPKGHEGYMRDWDLYEFTRAIEAKMKERNA